MKKKVVKEKPKKVEKVKEVEVPVKVEEVVPVKDKTQELRDVLVFFRDNVVHGNESHVKIINNVLEKEN